VIADQLVITDCCELTRNILGRFRNSGPFSMRILTYHKTIAHDQLLVLWILRNLSIGPKLSTGVVLDVAWVSDQDIPGGRPGCLANGTAP